MWVLTTPYYALLPSFTKTMHADNEWNVGTSRKTWRVIYTNLPVLCLGVVNSLGLSILQSHQMHEHWAR